MKRFLSFLVLIALVISSPVFALSPSARLILFSGDGRLSGASVDFNFTQSQYYGCDVGCISLSRASPGYAQTSAGTWQSFGSNVLRITDQGLLIEEARTNKCTNFNANLPTLVAPTSPANFVVSVTNMSATDGGGTLDSVVDDSAAISAAGLSAITTGRAYKIDNSAGAASAQLNPLGSVGNLNPQTYSVYARGSGQFILRDDAGGTTFPLTPQYQRYVITKTPTGTNFSLRIQAQPGAIVYFTLNQLEEGSFVTSPIVTAGASATRAADIPQLTGAALTAALNAKAAFFQTSGAQITSGIPGRLFGWDGGAVGSGNMAFPTTTTVRISGNSSADATIGGAGVISGFVKSAFGFDASSVTVLANGGTKASIATAWGTGTTPYLGNLSTGNRALNGYMQRFALSPNKGQFDNKTQ